MFGIIKQSKHQTHTSRSNAKWKLIVTKSQRTFATSTRYFPWLNVVNGQSSPISRGWWKEKMKKEERNENFNWFGKQQAIKILILFFFFALFSSFLSMCGAGNRELGTTSIISIRSFRRSLNLLCSSTYLFPALFQIKADHKSNEYGKGKENFAHRVRNTKPNITQEPKRTKKTV